MNDKMKKIAKKASELANGKGFYAVLFLCVAAIAISGYVIFFSGGAAVDPANLAQTTPTGTMPPYMAGTTESDIDVVSPVTLPPVTEKPATTTSSRPATVFYVRPLSGSAQQAFSGGDMIFNPTMDDWRTHNGVDLRANIGDKVAAVADGAVADVYEDDFRGRTIEISHADGVTSIYCNLAKDVTVKKGDTVKAGQTIGTVGNTALLEALDPVHLHLEMKRGGNFIDPLTLIPPPAN